MNYLSWLIPGLIALFLLGKVAEVLRAMRGSIEEDLSFLRAALGDVQRRCRTLHNDGQIPEFVRSRIRARLAEARQTLQACDRDLLTAKRVQRIALRTRVKRALTGVSQARSLLRPYLAEDDREEIDKPN